MLRLHFHIMTTNDAVSIAACGYSLQGFFGHAASPEAGPIEQHLPKVLHLGIQGPLVTATTQSQLIPNTQQYSHVVLMLIG